jgi:hypothetical protein
MAEGSERNGINADQFAAKMRPLILELQATGAGYGAIARELDRVRVFSRRGHDWTDRVPRIADALTALGVTSITPDGEA